MNKIRLAVNLNRVKRGVSQMLNKGVFREHTNSFEGIRSEKIESLLLRYFNPVEMWRGNCFLWRLVNPAYFSNYDLKNREDRYMVLSLVAAEHNLWKAADAQRRATAYYRKR
jgi:hypothetical protein